MPQETCFPLDAGERFDPKRLSEKGGKASAAPWDDFPAVPSGKGPVKDAGLYIHVPFCLKKCPYCNFYSVKDLDRIPAYLKSLHLELAGIAPRWSDLFFDSVYFGGGTPSLLTPGEVEGVLDGILKHFRCRQDLEVTLEANPATVDANRLKAYRSAGINRLNIGIQSFSAAHLAFLGRVHTPTEAGAALEDAGRAGFEKIGIDLIYGLPGQTQRQWRKDLERATAHGPAHLSCYLLSFEPQTPLEARRRAGEIAPMPPGRQAGLFLDTAGYLEDRGYTHYEVSNFARKQEDAPGIHRSRHNQKYWNFSPYAGAGPAAHSFRENRRWWNINSLEAYLQAAAPGRPPMAGIEVLSTRQQQMEAVYLGLRRREGLDVKALERRFGLSFYAHTLETVRALKQEGWVSFTEKGFALTRRGMLFLDAVAGALIGCLP